MALSERSTGKTRLAGQTARFNAALADTFWFRSCNDICPEQLARSSRFQPKHLKRNLQEFQVGSVHGSQGSTCSNCFTASHFAGGEIPLLDHFMPPFFQVLRHSAYEWPASSSETPNWNPYSALFFEARCAPSHW